MNEPTQQEIEQVAREIRLENIEVSYLNPYVRALMDNYESESIARWHLRKVAELRDSSRKLCQIHPQVDYKTAWGCPECVREMRAEIKQLKATVKAVTEGSFGSIQAMAAENAELRRKLEQSRPSLH